MFKALGEQLRKPSGLFGRLVSVMMDMRNREFYENMLTELEIKSGDRIYEIGYGPGLGINLIAKSKTDCSINGIDFSELMYYKAITRNKKFVDAGFVDLKYGDFLTSDIDHEQYDKIFCINVIYFWSDLTIVFDKIYSMLSDGGLFCIFMTPAQEMNRLKFADDFFKYSIESVESDLKKVGFKSVAYRLDKGYYIKASK